MTSGPDLSDWDEGEAYADETVTVNLLRQAEKMVKAGVKVDAREYEQAGD